MSGDDDVFDDDGSGADHEAVEMSAADISTADQQALTDLFAALTADSPPTEVSPLEIIKLGKAAERDAEREESEALARADQRMARARKVRRFKVVRNVLVAAAVAGLVVVIVPHLNNASSSPAASPINVPFAAPAASAAAPPAAAASGSPDFAGGVTNGGDETKALAAPSAASASSAASAAGTSSAPAAGSSAAASNEVLVPGADGTGTRSQSAAALSSAASSAPANSAPASSGASASTGTCASLPARALTAFRSAFPAGYFGPPVPGAGARPCGLFESALPVVKKNVVVTVSVRRAAVDACRSSACQRASGYADVYTSKSGGDNVVAPMYLYANGYEVAIVAQITGPTPSGPSFGELVTAGRALIKTLP